MRPILACHRAARRYMSWLPKQKMLVLCDDREAALDRCRGTISRQDHSIPRDRHGQHGRPEHDSSVISNRPSSKPQLIIPDRFRFRSEVTSSSLFAVGTDWPMGVPLSPRRRHESGWFGGTAAPCPHEAAANGSSRIACRTPEAVERLGEVILDKLRSKEPTVRQGYDHRFIVEVVVASDLITMTGPVKPPETAASGGPS